VLTFQIQFVFISLGIHLDIYKEHFLDDIIRSSIETHIECAWAVELRNFHVCNCDSINGLSSTWFEPAQVTARVHFDVKHFRIFFTANNDILEVNAAASFLKALTCMVPKVLLSSNCYGKIEVVSVLTDLNWVQKVAWLEERASDRHFLLLSLVKSNLKRCVDRYDKEYDQSAD